MTKYISMLLVIISGLLYGNSIDAQIEAIRKAPVEKRFELMNAFKHKIIQMHEEERIEAIHKLKSITKSKYGNHALKEIKARQQSIQRKKQQLKHIHGRSKSKKIERTVEKHIESHIEHQLEDQIENQVDDQITEGVENEIENQLEDEHADND